MRIEFVAPQSGTGVLAEGEIVFDEAGPLEGMKLVGFAVRRSDKGGFYVTFPSRAFGTATERRYFDFLRPVDGYAGKEVTSRVKRWISDAYSNLNGAPLPQRKREEAARGSSNATAASKSSSPF